tara:strand:+ start:11313 stop:11591 length:279 start_codon:yes stop_codon:yes gene_type:complete
MGDLEIINSLLSQAPSMGMLGLVMWFMVKHQPSNLQNGTKEIVRGIERNLEKMAEAQVQSNVLSERKVRAFERIAESLVVNNSFQSRKRKSE